MCGILLEVVALALVHNNKNEGEETSVRQDAEAQPPQQTVENLVRRGPDHLGHVSTTSMVFDDSNHHRHHVTLKASVLQMRSNSTPQPLKLQPTSGSTKSANNTDSTKNSVYFCWNGEVYQRMAKEQRKYQLEERGDNNQNDDDNDDFQLETVASYNVADTQLVADMLLESHEKITTLYFGDDDNGTIITEGFMEAYASAVADVFGRLVNAEYAFCIVTPWAAYYGRDPQGRRSLLHCWSGDDDKGGISISRTSESSSGIPTSWKLASVTEKQQSQEKRASSPGDTPANDLVWKEVVPGIVHEYRFQTGQALSSTPIILPRLRRQPLDSILPLNTTAKNTIPENTSPSMWKASLALEHWLRQAVQLRVCGGHHFDANNNNSTTSATSARIAVLFSGGIDSVVLAALTLQVIPPEEPLYLWNVSFVDEHHCTDTNVKSDSDIPSKSAAKDCLAAQASYEELKQLFPHHTILMETTEVSWEEMTQREAHIRTLIHPKTTTMDLNIAMALWFASQGDQQTRANKDSKLPTATGRDDTETPRILLVGMGADEQLGGYGRHRKAYKRSDNNKNGGQVDTCLRQELDLDIERLWERNLGRDDRIFSDHGKEARFPYLDYHVMQFLKQTPLHDVCDFSLPPGEGDKRILRLMAMRLGLKTASGLVKRAIQFGSRIAHVSDKRRFGSRRKAQGTAVV